MKGGTLLDFIMWNAVPNITFKALLLKGCRAHNRKKNLTVAFSYRKGNYANKDP